ncbi:MAG: TRASH domain-containing protein [Thermoplasmataceae archaeon]
MQKQLPELEQRMINILKRNSRTSLTDLARSLRISRITASKIFESLVSSGRLKRFTVLLEEEERDLAIVQVKGSAPIQNSLILEKFDLIDGSQLLIMYYEDLVKLPEINIERIEVARSRTIFDNLSRSTSIHCDYCNNIVIGKPIPVEQDGELYYACCPNCEKDLKRRFNAEKESH